MPYQQFNQTSSKLLISDNLKKKLLLKFIDNFLALSLPSNFEILLEIIICTHRILEWG